MSQGKTNFCIIYLTYRFQNYINQFEFVEYFYPNYRDSSHLNSVPYLHKMDQNQNLGETSYFLQGAP